MRLRILTGFMAALTIAVPLAAQQPVPAEAQTPPPAPATSEPPADVPEVLDLGVDRAQRMTVPVNIGGRGPYSFIVDTGSERTVISRELADRLRLGPGRTAMVYSMTEASRIDTVVIPALEVGQRTINDIHAPALARINLGAEGMLGVDTLQSQRVELDFRRQEMTVTPSRRSSERPWPSDTIVITARSRYGHLMITDASFDGQRIIVVIDTGSQVTVGNMELQRRLRRRGRLGPLHPLQLISVTGGSIEASYGIARNIRVGTAEIRDLPIAFADVHPFRQLRLLEEPAILLGMDGLRLFQRVSVDFANRRVRLLVPDSSENRTAFRMAER